jgi:tripartite-type tricarboxylate transporter receptor subunit TctC
VRAGRLRGLAVTSAKRSDIAPELPTMAEFLPGFAITSWGGVMAPAGLPDPILRRMNTDINRIITTPEFRTWLVQDQAITPPAAPNTPEQFRETLARDITRWAEVVRRSGATVD